jgi:hypothetical protein
MLNQEVNGGGGGDQSPTPTEGADERGGTTTPSEDKLIELEEELREFDDIRSANTIRIYFSIYYQHIFLSDKTHDPDSMIYSRSFLMLLRKVTHVSQKRGISLMIIMIPFLFSFRQ